MAWYKNVFASSGHADDDSFCILYLCYFFFFEKISIFFISFQPNFAIKFFDQVFFDLQEVDKRFVRPGLN